MKVTSGNGGWTILQSGVTVNNRKITYGTVGLSRFGSATSAKQRVTKTGLGSSWSFSTPASWVHVYNGTVGVTSNAKLGGRSTANLQLINNWTF